MTYLISFQYRMVIITTLLKSKSIPYCETGSLEISSRRRTEILVIITLSYSSLSKRLQPETQKLKQLFRKWLCRKIAVTTLLNCCSKVLMFYFYFFWKTTILKYTLIRIIVHHRKIWMAQKLKKIDNTENI